MHLNFKGKDLMKLMDLSKAEINTILDVSAELKRKLYRREPHDYLKNRAIAVLFEKQSTRTRTSFETAIIHLGAGGIYMTPDKMQLSRGELVKDTARVLDRFVDGLVMRTFGQERLEEFAYYMQNPVINALTDLTHPMQIFADFLTIREKLGRLEGLKIVYAGDIWNVAHSMMAGCAIMGMDLYIPYPEGYEPNPDILKFARETAAKSGSKLVLTHDMEEAATDADIIYANTWHSMGGPEKSKEQRIIDFMPFQINQKVMQMAKPEALFMHPLPGYRGEDMTDEVIEGPQSIVFDQAENRLHTAKAVLSLFIG